MLKRWFSLPKKFITPPFKVSANDEAVGTSALTEALKPIAEIPAKLPEGKPISAPRLIYWLLSVNY